uniref:C2 domain-containing protein n=1 Tax=Heterorhabditis bacteriophora TaxID=37862 RepID=A0A1I7XM86_HETBA
MHSDSTSEDPSRTHSARIILTMSARNLKDTDINSVSDPFCVVYASYSTARIKHWKDIGRTEASDLNKLMA